MSRFELIYSYDGDAIGDLRAWCAEGISYSKIRNGVGAIEFSLSLRSAAAWCASRNFDIKRMFTPMRSSIVLYDNGAPVVGGWLAATPNFELEQSPDALAPFSFVDWLGLTAGAYLHPQITYTNVPFNQIAVLYTQQIIARTASAGRKWPISASLADTDTLARVDGTIDSLKSLKDFLLERTDNTTGTQTFDVYFDPFGAMQIRKHYGYDVTQSAVFTFPDRAELQGYGIKKITLPPWDNYVSDYYLSGAGNGYEDESGEGGTVITSQARNTATIANTGYWEGASAESDISEQATLDARATSFVKDTEKAFASPSITIDADPFKLYAHEEGGNLWLGDTVRTQLADWAAEILPLDVSQNQRIVEVAAHIDSNDHTEAVLTMAAS